MHPNTMPYHGGKPRDGHQGRVLLHLRALPGTARYRAVLRDQYSPGCGIESIFNVDTVSSVITSYKDEYLRHACIHDGAHVRVRVCA